MIELTNSCWSILYMLESTMKRVAPHKRNHRESKSDFIQVASHVCTVRNFANIVTKVHLSKQPRPTNGTVD